MTEKNKSKKKEDEAADEVQKETGNKPDPGEDTGVATGNMPNRQAALECTIAELEKDHAKPKPKGAVGGMAGELIDVALPFVIAFLKKWAEEHGY